MNHNDNKYTRSIQNQSHAMVFPALSTKTTTPVVTPLDFKKIIHTHHKKEEEEEQESQANATANATANANEVYEEEEDYKICLEHRIKRTLKEKKPAENVEQQSN